VGNIQCYFRFGNERDVEHRLVVPGHGDEPDAGNACRTPVRRGDENMLTVNRNSRSPAIEPYGEQGFKIMSSMDSYNYTRSWDRLNSDR
jgi:hypothetical protein